MSEAVEILIKADDQASQKFAESSANMVQSMKRAEQIMSQLQEPADRYAKQLAEIEALHKSGALTADQFAAAQASLTEKMSKANNSIKEVGEKAKVTTEFVGTLASLAGGSEFASFASQIAGATEKVGQFSEVANAGGAGALTFKLGLIGLAATIGGTIGKALGDFIFQTKKLEREMQRAKEAAAQFDERLQRTRANMFSGQKQDIELIRDPEKKKAAYEALLGKLDKDLATVSMNVKESEKAVERWAEAWQITGERKASAIEAQEQLKADQERLSVLREERQEIQMMISTKEQERAAIAAANEAKDASENYLQTLREEVELLKATKEEQLQIEAAKNTTLEDRGEAEKLLKERDAIVAKLDAERQLEQERQQAAEQALQQAEQEKQRLEDLMQSENERLELRRIEIEQGKEAARIQGLVNQGVEESAAKQIAAAEAVLKAKEDQMKADEQKASDAINEQQRIADLVKSEETRLALRKIEVEQGKEAAKVQALINQGVDEATAKKLAAEEASLETPQQKAPSAIAALQASESRLLTRGEGNEPLDKLKQSFDGVKSEIAKQNALQAQSLDAQRKIAENTAKGSVLVPVA
jgi:DNA repair exonuclease SbcCD ATPase subunit